MATLFFALAYAIEILFLYNNSHPAHLELYISGFSITGSEVRNTSFIFFLLCIIFNLINVWMEEGLFRGFFIKTISEKYYFRKANLIAALLFGLWHIVMPNRSFVNGDMLFIQMLLLGFGYIILSGLMSINGDYFIKFEGVFGWAWQIIFSIMQLQLI